MEDEISDETITFSGTSLGKSLLRRKYHRKLSESRGIILSNIKIHQDNSDDVNSSVPFQLPSDNTVRIEGAAHSTLSSAVSSTPITFTVFFSNLDHYVKLHIADDNLATAGMILQLALKELHFYHCTELFALWMCSNYLEIQLKPHNVPLLIRCVWPKLLEKYTSASLNARNNDNEPLLVLRRNVYLSYHRECEILQGADDKIIEFVYNEVCNNVHLGRLMVPFETAIFLSSVNACIDQDFKKGINDDKFLNIKLKAYLPSVYGDNIESWWSSSKFRAIKRLFFAHYNSLSGTSNTATSDIRNLRIKYLNICMDLPLYGCAFFDGYIEKQSLLGNYNQKISIYVAINRHFVCLVDSTKYLCLLNVSLADCSWKSTVNMKNDMNISKLDSSSSIFLHFYPDKDLNSSKLIRIISQQAPMIEALLNSCRFLNKNMNHISALSTSLDDKSKHLHGNCDIYRNKWNKISVADFDADGHCIKAPLSLGFLSN